MATISRSSLRPSAACLTGLVFLFSYLIVLMFLPAVAMGDPPSPAQAAPPTGAAHPPASAAAVSDVGSGSLLLSVAGTEELTVAPLVATEVKIAVNGLVSRARVTQTFHNPGESWAEGIYVFPLPEDAAVDHMTLRVGDRIIEGRIEERGEARRIYEEARHEGRRAGLIDQERPNVFTASIANIGPGEEVVMALDYQEALRYDQGAFRLRFPMVVAPRYVPGQVRVAGLGGGGTVNTGEVPDADRVSPPIWHPDVGKTNPVALTVDLNPGFELAGIKSPYHNIAVAERPGGRYEVKLAAGVVPADRDFELVWTPALGAAPQAAVFTETRGGEHHLLVMVMPPAAPAANDSADDRAAVFPREVIYVIDTSGSMAGDSIVQAREALLLALDRLTPRDRFNIIGFNDTAFVLFPAPRPVDARTLAAARRFVARLEADGGTEMAPALTLALRDAPPPGVVRQVVFLTDGAVADETRLFGIIHDRLGSARLFPIAIGSAPNGYFMTKAAEVGRGAYTYIGSESEVGERMGLLFEKLERPVLTDLAVAWPGDAAPGDAAPQPVSPRNVAPTNAAMGTGAGADGGPGPEMYPRRLPDLYAGEPVVFTARLGDAVGPITLSGRRAGEPWQATLTPEGEGTAEGVARLWAADKVDALMNGLHEGADPDEVRRQVVAVALANQLVTSYTSLVAVDATPARPADAPLTSRNVPANLPHGWVFEKIFGLAGEGAAPAWHDAAAPPLGPALAAGSAGGFGGGFAAAYAPVMISPAGGLGMPQGATPAPLHMLLAALLLSLGLVALWLRRRAA